MAATIPGWIVGLRGQCVKQATWDDERATLIFHCDRDHRFKPVDHRTGSRGIVNRWLRREIQNPRRMAALDVMSKLLNVRNYHDATIKSFLDIVGTIGPERARRSHAGAYPASARTRPC